LVTPTTFGPNHGVRCGVDFGALALIEISGADFGAEMASKSMLNSEPNSVPNDFVPNYSAPIWRKFALLGQHFICLALK